MVEMIRRQDEVISAKANKMDITLLAEKKLDKEQLALLKKVFHNENGKLKEEIEKFHNSIEDVKARMQLQIYDSVKKANNQIIKGYEKLQEKKAKMEELSKRKTVTHMGGTSTQNLEVPPSKSPERKKKKAETSRNNKSEVRKSITK